METVAFDGTQPTQSVGHYVYSVTDDAWSWADGVYLLHGYAPREVPATTEVLLRHKHPDDRSRAAGALQAAAENGEPFSCYHRIIDRRDRVRSVLSVGQGIKDTEGRVVSVEGYFVDLTEIRRSETQADVETALARIAEHRESIDQAKGMVMLATGCDAAAAFETLRQHSQNANIKLHEVARRLVEAISPDHRGSDLVMAFLEDLK